MSMVLEKVFIPDDKKVSFTIDKCFVGKRLFVSIDEFSNKRSNLQNRYYWVVVKYGCDYFGYSKEEMHEEFKRMFNKSTYISKTTGELVEYGSRTSILSKGGFVEYLNKCVLFLAEYGVHVPTPEEYYGLDTPLTPLSNAQSIATEGN